VTGPGPSRRVGVNLTWLNPGIVGGSEESTTDTLRAVADLLDDPSRRRDGLEPGPEVELFVAHGFSAAHPDLAERFRTHVVPGGPASRSARVIAEHRWLPGALRDAGVDLVHHAGGTAPLWGLRPYALTIHDLQPLDLPRNFPMTKRAYLRAMIGRSARGARRVGVPSEFVRSRVLDRFGLGDGDVAVVPWSVRDPSRPTSPAADPAGRLDVRRRLGVGERYLLFPAITHPHKNHVTVLAAFDRVAASDDAVELVLCGGVGRAEDEVVAARSALVHGDRVHRLGRIDRTDLDSLYVDASAMVFPSRYEGFGLPVLEAMVRDCPVICSSTTALGEVAGEGARLVDPDDVDAWAAEIARVLVEPADGRAARIAAGRARAATFSAARSAGATLSLWS